MDDMDVGVDMEPEPDPTDLVRRRGQALVALANLGVGPAEGRRLEADLARGLGGSAEDEDVYMQRAFAALLDVKGGVAGERSATAALADILDFGNPAATETSVSCRKCGSTHVRAEARQTRSADEAPTIFFHCQACQSKWRCYS